LSTPKNIIVVGGNAAGPAAAAKAKRVDPDANVILFEAGEYISTGTCELPYVLSGEIEDYKDIIFFSPESFYNEKGVKVYTRYHVEKLDRKNKKVTVKNLNDNTILEFPYDKLILTTGSLPKKLPSLSADLDNVFYLKSVSDFLKIKSYLKSDNVRNILIIGAGYIGLEASEALKKLGNNVTILEKENLPMPGIDPEVQNLIFEIIQKNEINFQCGAEKAKFILDGSKLKGIKFEGRFVEYDMVLVAIGFEPNNALAISSRLNIGEFGGIKVDNKLKTSCSNIFAAGDNIEIINGITGKNDYIPVATIAHRYGHIAGANAAGGKEIARPIIKNIAVKIFDKAFVNIGLSFNEAQKFGYNVKSVYTIAPNLVQVMPESKKVFGKINFDRETKQILGASFLGDKEVIGYGDLIATLIYTRSPISILTKIDFNYTPPYSPFVNILSILGRKAEKEIL
jgi:NADPH-dependent 2,4-dienoyl-CoA reductase/sulfur reductase-like enzyme